MNGYYSNKDELRQNIQLKAQDHIWEFKQDEKYTVAVIEDGLLSKLEVLDEN